MYIARIVLTYTICLSAHHHLGAEGGLKGPEMPSVEGDASASLPAVSGGVHADMPSGSVDMPPGSVDVPSGAIGGASGGLPSVDADVSAPGVAAEHEHSSFLSNVISYVADVVEDVAEDVAERLGYGSDDDDKPKGEVRRVKRRWGRARVRVGVLFFLALGCIHSGRREGGEALLDRLLDGLVVLTVFASARDGGRECGLLGRIVDWSYCTRHFYRGGVFCVLHFKPIFLPIDFQHAY